MQKTRRPSWASAIGMLVVAGGILAASLPLEGGELAHDFLEGLRQRQLYDVALDYLESLRANPKTEKSILEAWDYELGVTLFAAAREKPVGERERELDKAQQAFQKFLSAQPQHPLAASAERQLASLLLERGEMKMAEAYQPGKTAAEKKRLLEQSRKIFQDAFKALEAVDQQLAKLNKRFKNVDPNDQKLLAERDRLRGEIMLTRFDLAKTLYEVAFTFEPESNERKALLAAAANKFSEYYWKYNRWLGGYTFRLEQARCYKELGDYARAFSILEELATPQPDDDEGMRRIRIAAVELALQIALLPQVKKYEEAWQTFENWERSLAPPSMDETAAAIKCLGGEVALELARSLNPADPEAARRRSTFRQRAKELFMTAISYPGPHRVRAQLKLGDPLLGDAARSIQPPKNYAEAVERGKLAWNQLRQPELNAEEIERLQNEAISCFRFALAHPQPEPNMEEMNVLRHWLAYLEWTTGKYYEAALLGEFLARRYPDRPQGQGGAEIALAAYAALSEEGDNDEQELAAAGLLDLARFIDRQWSGSSLADGAWARMVRIAVVKNDLSSAAEYLQRISAGTPNRGKAELMLGQAYWRKYLQEVRLPPEKQPPKNILTRRLEEAEKLLKSGVDNLRGSVEKDGLVPYGVAAGALSLGQICLEQNRSEEALQWLDDPKIGAHWMALSENKTFDQGNFRIEALKAVLRAYVAAQLWNNAEQTMEVLEKKAGGEIAMRIYLGLGRQLEDSLQSLRASGKKEEWAKASRGFDLFLSRISQRPAAETTFDILYWAAEAFMKLGLELAPENGKLPTEAEYFFRKAAQVYKRILDIHRENPDFIPQEGAIEAIQIRLARCYRRMGKYSDALDQLAETLKAHNNLLDAQREAAYTYQDWGKERPAFYVLAMRGGRKIEGAEGTRYLFWGWNGIARRTQALDAYQDAYDEARYNLAFCRLKYAQSKSGKEQTDLLRETEREILVMLRLRPTMGGPKWFEKYDQLLKEVQARLGVKEDQRGLQAAEARFSKPAKSAVIPKP